jgi:hypothetical protein
LRLSAEAFAAGQLDAAFGSLQTALNSARLVADDAPLTEVGCRAADMRRQLLRPVASLPSFEAQVLSADLDQLERQVMTLLEMRRTLRWTGATAAPRH